MYIGNESSTSTQTLLAHSRKNVASPLKIAKSWKCLQILTYMNKLKIKKYMSKLNDRGKKKR